MNSKDYQRVEKAIRYLDDRRSDGAVGGGQPSLEEIATHVGLSPPYFQRLFKRWAGVSPKQFLQFLTLGYAKQRLRDSRTVLDATYDAGLSSQGRLHDLFVTIEAATPGEYKTGGAGLEIRYGVHDSPFGDCLIATTTRGVCWLAFLAEGKAEASEKAFVELRDEWRAADISEDSEATGKLVKQIFSVDASTKPSSDPVRLFLKGTNFQLQVWQALLRIPEGATVSYQHLAEHLGRPKASRAVGSAVARNPISWLIPCHRVLRQVGVISGYRWGVPRKKALLAWEAAKTRGDSNLEE